MKQHLKQLACTMLCALMLFCTVPVSAGEPDDEFSVTISVEGATLEQGFYVPPTRYTLSEINTILSAEGYGPYTEETLTAGMVTLAMLLERGINYTATGSWESDVYLSAVKDIDKGDVNIPSVITENGGPSNEQNDGNADDFLGEFDYSFMSGWMITVDHHMIGVGCGKYDAEQAASEGATFQNGSVIRWQFTLYGYGLDLGIDNGWGMGDPYYSGADKSDLFRQYAYLDRMGFFNDHPTVKSEVLGVMENLCATQEQTDNALAYLRSAEEESATPDVANVLSDALLQLKQTVPAPAFGTGGGEWTVLSLARGDILPANDSYFTDYYARIEETVRTKAEAVNLNGALHKTKSTENSRLILALSAIGKDAREVGGWDLIAPYSQNGLTWIQKQGINGPIFALLALDSNRYETTDPTIRNQCIEFILSKELTNGGWALSGQSADPDITAMALQSLAPYTDQEPVQTACNRAFAVLSSIQTENGGYTSWGSVNSESIAQVIVACTSHGINPHTDPRFVKNGRSAVDALLDFYLPEGHGFAHVLTGDVNGMATDQACYALVAYQRYLDGKTRLYDMTDCFASPLPPSASLSLPATIPHTEGTAFIGTVCVSGWKETKGWKLLDATIRLPAGVSVTDVKASDRLSGGLTEYHLEAETGLLRIVYMDSVGLNDLTMDGFDSSADLFTISFLLTDNGTPESVMQMSLLSLNAKKTALSDTAGSAIAFATADEPAEIAVTEGMTFIPTVLFCGTGVDRIPADKTALALSVTHSDSPAALTYSDGTISISFRFSPELTEKTGMHTYVALVNSAIPLSDFAIASRYVRSNDGNAPTLLFGDLNGDGTVNAQDALNAINLWLRKTNPNEDEELIAGNINGDGGIDTLDALGILEAFINQSELPILQKTSAA